MNKIKNLRTYIKNGWNINNRKQVISEIGKKNFDDIYKLSCYAKSSCDIFEYQDVKDYFKENNVSKIKNYFLGMLDLLHYPAGCNKGNVYKKIKTSKGEIIKEPIEVSIEPNVCFDKFYGLVYEYTFIDKNKEIGYVAFKEYFNLLNKGNSEICNTNKLLMDYPEQGVVGNRLLVTMLLNEKSQNYSGIGNLADKLAVEHCLRRGVEPNIISEASWSSHLAHYLRGKRFISSDGKDYNEIVDKLAKNREIGKVVDTSNLGSVIAYMPKEMIERLKKEVLEKPLLKYLLKTNYK